jgi:hypothetical protein
VTKSLIDPSVPRTNFPLFHRKNKKIAKQGLISSRLPSPKPLILQAVGQKFPARLNSGI